MESSTKYSSVESDDMVMTIVKVARDLKLKRRKGVGKKKGRDGRSPKDVPISNKVQNKTTGISN